MATLTDSNQAALAVLASGPPFRTQFYNFCMGGVTDDPTRVMACLNKAGTIAPAKSGEPVTAGRLMPWIVIGGSIIAGVYYYKRGHR
jgi:hypothetical protein